MDGVGGGGPVSSPSRAYATPNNPQKVESRSSHVPTTWTRAGEARPLTNRLAMTRTTMTVTCPHCEAEIEVRIQTQVAPPLRLPFATEEEFAQWLRASRLSVDEFRRLPFYEWHRDQLEPLTRAAADDAEDETADEWQRDQLEPLSRGLADEAETKRRTPPRV